MKKSVIIGLDGKPYTYKTNYEGATSSNRAVHWSAPSVGPNRALESAAKPLRNRTRAGYRNSLLMRSAINKNTTSEVGKGFTLISTCQDDNFRNELNKLWKVASQQLDPWSDFNFNGLLHLAVKSRRMSGEVFIRRIRRGMNTGLAVPIQIELLEADLCPMDLNKKLSDTVKIIQGIEFNGREKAAYYFHKSHPDDGQDASFGYIRVPAADVIHHYMPTRPGQVRGEPETAAALLKDRTFHEYDDAELIRKRERSGFTGFLYRESSGDQDWEFDPATGKPLFPDDVNAAENYESVVAGKMLRGVPGEKLELFNGDNTGSGYSDYNRWQGLKLSSGQEIPYALLTGDWSGLNDRLVRAFMIEYRRGISFEQTNLSGFQVAATVWKWIVEDAILTNKLSAPNYGNDPYFFLSVDIRPDSWKHLHPTQEADARLKSITSQTSNIESEAAEFGRDLEDNMKRNARALRRWQEILQEEGITNPSEMAGVFSVSMPTGTNNE